MTRRRWSWAVVLPLAGLLWSCAAFETRPLCDADSDCAVGDECVSGFCIEATLNEPAVDGGVGPSEEPEPNEPSVAEPEADPNPEPSASPEPEAEPEAGLCETPSCGCDETTGPFEPPGDVALLCTESASFLIASQECRTRGRPALRVDPDQMDVNRNWLSELGLSSAWTGLFFDGDGITHEEFPDFRLRAEDIRWGESPPVMGQLSCISIDATSGLNARDCQSTRPFICGDFFVDSGDCNGADLASDPSNCGACAMQCLNFQCDDGYCASVTRATDVGENTQVAAAGDVYWVLRGNGAQTASIAAFRLSDTGGSNSILLGSIDFTEIGRMSKAPNGSVVALVQSAGGMADIVRGTAGDGVNSQTIASDVPVDQAFFTGPIVATNLRWFTPGVGANLLSGSLTGGDTETLDTAIELGAPIAHLATNGPTVLVGFENSGQTRAVSASDFALADASIEELPGPILAMTATANRFVAAYAVDGQVGIAWIEDLEGFNDVGNVNWIEGSIDVPLTTNQVRDMVVIGETAYFAGPDAPGIRAVSLEQSAPTLLVASGSIQSLDTVDSVLVWTTADGVLHEMIPPVYSP